MRGATRVWLRAARPRSPQKSERDQNRPWSSGSTGSAGPGVEAEGRGFRPVLDGLPASTLVGMLLTASAGISEATGAGAGALDPTAGALTTGSARGRGGFADRAYHPAPPAAAAAITRPTSATLRCDAAGDGAGGSEAIGCVELWLAIGGKLIDPPLSTRAISASDGRDARSCESIRMTSASNGGGTPGTACWTETRRLSVIRRKIWP